MVRSFLLAAARLPRKNLGANHIPTGSRAEKKFWIGTRSTAFPSSPERLGTECNPSLPIRLRLCRAALIATRRSKVQGRLETGFPGRWNHPSDPRLKSSVLRLGFGILLIRSENRKNSHSEMRVRSGQEQAAQERPRRSASGRPCGRAADRSWRYSAKANSGQALRYMSYLR